VADTELIAFFRRGVTLGVVPVSEIVAWADDIILRDAAPAPTILDLAIVAQDDRRGTLSLLRALSPDVDDEAPISRSLAGALLDRIRSDAFSGRRELAEIIGLIAAVRGHISPDDRLWHQITSIEADYDFAEDQIAGDMTMVTRITREWLAQFDGEADRFSRRGA
jgi:hypothetical protein